MSYNNAETTEVVKVMVFGDSITYGVWDDQGGWVQRLREPIDVKNLVNPDVAYFVYNLGIVDDTSTGVVKRFESEMASREYENTNQRTVVIFSLGLNDSQMVNGKARVSKEQLEKNVRLLIDLARKVADKIVFVGPTPVNEQKTMPITWDNTRSYKNSIVKEYEDVIRLVCKSENIFFVEVLQEMMKMDYTTLLADGVHPNPGGHLVLYELVRNFLTNNKILNFNTH